MPRTSLSLIMLHGCTALHCPLQGTGKRCSYVGIPVVKLVTESSKSGSGGP